MKTNKFFLVALIMMCAMTMTTVLISCSSDNNDVTEPIEYGKVYSYAYEGNTLYFVIDASLTAKIVAPTIPTILKMKTKMSIPGRAMNSRKAV